MKKKEKKKYSYKKALFNNFVCSCIEMCTLSH